jgi:hypothetical protein
LYSGKDNGVKLDGMAAGTLLINVMYYKIYKDESPFLERPSTVSLQTLKLMASFSFSQTSGIYRGARDTSFPKTTS